VKAEDFLLIKKMKNEMMKNEIDELMNGETEKWKNQMVNESMK